MSLRHTRPRARLLLCSILILLLPLPFFLPEIVSTYWHLRFGDSITFNGWAIPVPKGWAVFTRDDIFIIQKILRFYQSEDAPTISLGILSPGKPVDPERLKQASIRVISEQGYAFQEERPIQIAAHGGYCLHFTTGKDKKKIRISCDSLSAELSVDYFGQSSEIQTFYSVVGQIKRQDIR
jgi:hypothetical protein